MLLQAHASVVKFSKSPVQQLIHREPRFSALEDTTTAAQCRNLQAHSAEILAQENRSHGK
jgi:hypothetical protein